VQGEKRPAPNLPLRALHARGGAEGRGARERVVWMSCASRASEGTNAGVRVGSLGCADPVGADDAGFGFQGDVEAVVDGAGDATGEVEQFAAAGVAVVDQHEGVAGGDAGVAGTVAVAMAFPAAG